MAGSQPPLLTGTAILYRPLPAQTPARPRPAAPAPATAAEQQALLEKYCIVATTTSRKRRTSRWNPTDINTVGDHPEIWEKVIRKLRAGMMPPPGMPRPPLAQYEQFSDWLENQIDSKAAAHPDPGSVVMHRLNRTEYANAIRDLLDLNLDVNTLLPADDSARGFDNVAGSLTISPTLLEAYTTAATRIARTAVGFWKSPTAAAYIAPPDASQNQHLEGLPFGTRGGMAVHHSFPVRRRIQVLGPESRHREVHPWGKARVPDRQRSCGQTRLRGRRLERQ